MTKREQLKNKVIQWLKDEISRVEKMNDSDLADYIDAAPNCMPCIFDARKCNVQSGVRIYQYLDCHGDEEVEE